MHVEGVKQMFKGNNIAEVDANHPKEVVLEEIARLLNIRGDAMNTENVPKRAPKILLTGPPGSGWSTQAEKLSQRLNLVHVTTMVKNEIGKNTWEGKSLWKAIREGKSPPDEYIFKIVRERLSKLDCRINGYVLEGFPSNHR